MMTDRLKVRLGITGDGEDELLASLIDSAKAYAVGYCRLDAYDTKLDSVCIQMAAEDYGRLNADGVDRRNFSGVYESYRDCYSDQIMALLRRNRRMAVI